MKTIEDLRAHREDRVRDLAAKATRYRGWIDRQEVTPAEYQSLRAQLLDLQALHSTAVRAEERQALAEAVEFLKTWLPAVLT
jgi:hypothetical protein